MPGATSYKPTMADLMYKEAATPHARFSSSCLLLQLMAGDSAVNSLYLNPNPLRNLRYRHRQFVQI